MNSIVSPNEETDAALRTTVSLPTAENVLNLDIINTIEDALDDQEIVCTIFFIYLYIRAIPIKDKNKKYYNHICQQTNLF